MSGTKYLHLSLNGHYLYQNNQPMARIMAIDTSIGWCIMDSIINKYRDWVCSLTDVQADLIACVGYVSWCSLLAIGLVHSGNGPEVLVYGSYGLAGLITLSAYL